MPASRERALFVGSSAFDLPLPPPLERKWRAVGAEIDIRILARAGRVSAPDPRFRLFRPSALGGAGWYARLPGLVHDECRRFRPDVVVAQNAYDAFAALPGLRGLDPRPRLVVELHGDTALSARAYGSPLRRAYAPLADQAARFALRRADATRAVSDATADIARAATGREPEARFAAYVDLETFLNGSTRPLPQRPAVAWIGALERVKDPDAVIEAWQTVERVLPSARLFIVGDGRLRGRLESLTAATESIQVLGRLTTDEVRQVIDESTLLCVTSVSEGGPRVAVEALSCGRPVVAFKVAGLSSLVADGRSGRLVPRRDIDALGGALVELLRDRDLAEQLGAQGCEDVRANIMSAAGYAAAVGDMVRRVSAA
jgi:glycosyltransferase involved in cell wall biosynthesis